MALVTDFIDPFGGPRVVRFPDFLTDHLVSDVDPGGYQFIGLDISNIEFEPVAAHRVFAGPASGSAAAPAFRTLTATEVGAQPQSDNLDYIADLADGITALGANLMTLDVPSETSFLTISHSGTPDYQTISDIALAIGDEISTIGGLTISASSDFTMSVGGALEFTQSFYTGLGDVAFITEGATATITLPALGTVWTTENLNTDPNLGRSSASNNVCSSQKAVRDYVNSRSFGVVPLSAETSNHASASTLDLSGEEVPFVIVSGTTDIDEIIVAEGAEFMLIFEDALTVGVSSNLVTKSGKDIVVAAGDRMIVSGGESDVTTVLFSSNESGQASESFTNIAMASGGGIGFDYLAAYFDVGRSGTAAGPFNGAFIRFTDGDTVKFMSSDETVAVSLGIADVTANRAIQFPDQAGTLAILPSGGTTGQVLAKASNADYDYEWITP